MHKLQLWFSHMFSKIYDAMPFASGPEVTEEELRQLSPFAEHAFTPFDHENLRHQQTLRDLWARLTNGQPPPNEALVFKEWCDFGFQQQDPASDFRAVGVFGIHNLLFLADAHAEEFTRMSPDRADKYPFAITGLNISMMLLALLNVTAQKTCFHTTHENTSAQAKRARKAFVQLMLSAPDVRSQERVFGQVYCVAFLLLDKYWSQANAPNMLMFNEVLRSTRTRLDEVLIVSRTVDELFSNAGV